MIRFIKNIYIELASSKYLKHLFVLTSGVGVSQLIPLLLLPLLTRFFSPVDFGVFALFMATIQLLSILMTFRLEMAVVLPKKDPDAALLCLISFFALCFLSFIVSILIFILYNTSLANFLGESAIIPNDILWVVFCLIPVGSFCLGCYNILYSWNNRQELYRNMSYSHIIHSVFSTPASILFYFSKLNSVGLILGQILGRCIACFFLFSDLCQQITLIPKEEIRFRSMVLLKKYKKFIIFETPHAILNFMSQKFILGIFSWFFGFFTVGIFELADKLLGKPLGIISNSFKTVFYKRLTTAKDKLMIFKKSLLLMTIISFTLTIPFYIIPDDFFVFLLGNEWGDTGKYIQLLCPLLLSRFIFNVVMPSISYTLQNHYLLIWQIIYFISLMLLFWLIHELTVENVLLLYAIFGACMYAALGCVSFLVLKNHVKN